MLESAKRFLRRFFKWQRATQVPGRLFPWPKNLQLMADDDVVLALPGAIVEPEEKFGEVISGHDDMEFTTSPDGDVIYLRLKPGMSVSITKSCQAMVVSDDATPKRFLVKWLT